MVNSKSKLKNGFTLIELIIGITIFLLLFVGIIGVLIFNIRSQRKALAQQEILNQMSFSMEYMSRALRMAIRDDLGSCLSLPGLSYENPGADIFAVKFINHLQGDDCQEFFLEDGTLKYRKGASSPIALTSPYIVIEDLKFYISGQFQSDDLQPRVTIFIKAVPLNFSFSINLQSTVSQRNLDVE